VDAIEGMTMILVTGATGNVGRNVVTGLLERGTGVRALVRDPARANLPDGVEVVQGDLARPETLPAALDGVDAVFLVWPFATADAAPPVLAAIGAHTRRVVYLSAFGTPDDPEPRPGELFHTAMERLIRRSGLTWTFVRPGGFAANTLGWAASIRTDGNVQAPYGAAGRSLIHEKDIADVAVYALTTDGQDGAAYELTGPEVLTQAEQVRVIGEVVGRRTAWDEIGRDEALRRMLADGWSPAFAESALTAWAAMIDEPETVTDTVERVTGHPARTVRAWVADHADAFA
jgi:uncharacterized protein YbjT (DUF2867 family)